LGSLLILNLTKLSLTFDILAVYEKAL